MLIYKSQYLFRILIVSDNIGGSERMQILFPMMQVPRRSLTIGHARKELTLHLIRLKLIY